MVNIKKELIIGIIGSAIILLSTYFFILQYKNQQNNIGKVKLNNTIVPTASKNQSITLTTAEVAKHNSQSDCWIIISGSVYNVTNYLGVHPGGAARIISYCGTDATTAFQTKGGQGSHSAAADQALASLIIGSLNQTVSVGNTSNQTSPAPIINSGRGREEEDD